MNWFDTTRDTTRSIREPWLWWGRHGARSLSSFLPVQRQSWVNWCSLCTGRNRWINSELSGALIMTNEGSFLQNDQKETFVVMRSPLRKEFLFLFLLMQRENQLTPCALWTRRNRRETLSLVVPVSQRSFPVAPTSQKAAEHIKYPLLNPYLFLA